MNGIFWIRQDERCRLAIVARPRGFDWLEDDLKRLHSAGIKTLVPDTEEQRNWILNYRVGA